MSHLRRSQLVEHDDVSSAHATWFIEQGGVSACRTLRRVTLHRQVGTGLVYLGTGLGDYSSCRHTSLWGENHRSGTIILVFVFLLFLVAFLVETPIVMEKIVWEQGALVNPGGGLLYFCTTKWEQSTKCS